MRLFAISDIHVDYKENRQWLESLSRHDFQRDTLILAGDVSHVLDRIADTFALLLRRFANLCYLPGNHELWVMKHETGHSLDKLNRINELCQRWGVHVKPLRLRGGQGLWIVPLHAWYSGTEDPAHSLYAQKPGEDPSLSVWSDSYFFKWPTNNPQHPAHYFLAQNEPYLERAYDAPIVSFSHFLPRRDLIFGRKRTQPHATPVIRDRHPAFNFSRVAGTRGLDRQIRNLGSAVHVYGHQHRNRVRRVDGVCYVSHCLGYIHERRQGAIRYIDEGPRLIWQDGRFSDAILNGLAD